MSEALVEQIKRLEQQQAALKVAHRRLRFLTCALLLIAGSWGLMGETAVTHNQSLEAEQFILRGSDGKLRGALGIGENGVAGISLSDSKGVARVTVDLAEDGSPGIDLYDSDGKLRATLALGPKGTPGLGLYDPSGKLRTSLDIPAAETPGLAFYHGDGKPAWGAP